MDLPVSDNSLFDRVVSILEQSRASAVRAINNQMVIAYWLIGREIVIEIQGGEDRAKYGKQIIENLSAQLTEKYGKGFSVTSLQYYRKFYQVYINRKVISHPVGVESIKGIYTKIPHQIGAELCNLQKGRPESDESESRFSPHLSWSHYRALMRVNKQEARNFYESEAISIGWDKRTLERQIHSFYFERMLKSQNTAKMLESARNETTPSEPVVETLKNPYVLEFLGLPDVATLHETQLESAIITHLQQFLLELGKGFAFIARQKRMCFNDTDLYVDLVFYNCILKCYLLIDLKMGSLTHKDVGQMDGYVRMFDDIYPAKDDNPTIGLILCAEKNEAVAKYSVLKDRKHIFASKYMLYLPTEEELVRELTREQRFIEERLSEL